MSSLGVWFDGAIMSVEDDVTSSAWPSDALRFFLEDSPVEIEVDNTVSVKIHSTIVTTLKEHGLCFESSSDVYNRE